MKSVIIVSVVTFALIFGGVVLLSDKLPQLALPVPASPELTTEDHGAVDRVLQDLAVERDRIQKEQEQSLVLQQGMDVQEKVLLQASSDLQSLIGELRAERQVYDEQTEKAARKLAKMYENMKPDKAAPILAALDMETILDILPKMKEKAAAKVLSHMDAGLAAQISLHMTGQGER